MAMTSFAGLAANADQAVAARGREIVIGHASGR
jgi:hypothetical protein